MNRIPALVLFGLGLLISAQALATPSIYGRGNDFWNTKEWYCEDGGPYTILQAFQTCMADGYIDVYRYITRLGGTFPEGIVISLYDTKQINWTPPTTNCDGSTLTNLMEQRIYINGTLLATVPPETTSFEIGINGIQSQTIELSAVNSNGVESHRSACVITE